jgi:hypothetical protein
MTHLTRFMALLLLVGGPVVAAQRPPTPAPSVVQGTVWLTPSCGCCGKWVEHMQTASFKLTREVTTDMNAVAAHKRVPEGLRSCHTAVVGRYIIEGHVPADVVRKLLKEQPQIAGIAAPGMPIGSPGMEGPGVRPYSIVAFRKDGTTYEFAKR